MMANTRSRDPQLVDTRRKISPLDPENTSHQQVEREPDTDIPPDVFEALVAAWTEILVADYLVRHPIDEGARLGNLAVLSALRESGNVTL